RMSGFCSSSGCLSSASPTVGVWSTSPFCARSASVRRSMSCSMHSSWCDVFKMEKSSAVRKLRSVAPMCQASLSQCRARLSRWQTGMRDGRYYSSMQKMRPESETGPAYPIASVNNALLLLLLFREQPRVRLTDACKYLGVAHSTAHRLLAMLAHHGFVQQEPVTRAYVAGPALVEVGLAVVGSLNVREQARAVMEELAAETGETVHLGALEGNQVRYVDGLESERALRVVARTGTLAPAHCT